MEGIYLVGGGAFGLSNFYDCNVYLLDGGDELALIDTGSGSDVNAILRNIRGYAFDPNNIKTTIITHCHWDHIGGNKRVKELTGCTIAVHEAEAQAVEKLDSELVLLSMAKQHGYKLEPAEIDLEINEGDIINVGEHRLTILHTPGHTPGSVCLLLESKGKRILFAGDTLSAKGALNFINAPGFNLEAYKNSLKRIQDLHIDALLPGHYTFVLSEAHKHVKLYLDKVNSPWRGIVTPYG